MTTTTRQSPVDEDRSSRVTTEHPLARDAEAPATDLPVIDLVHPMAGFPEHRRFALVQLDDDGILCALRSLEDPDLRFLVVPPAPFFPDYAPVVDDATVADLEIARVEDVSVLVLLTAGDSLATTTANLRAPLLLNTGTRRAAQVLLDEPSLPTAVPLLS